MQTEEISSAIFVYDLVISSLPTMSNPNSSLSGPLLCIQLSSSPLFSHTKWWLLLISVSTKQSLLSEAVSVSLVYCRTYNSITNWRNGYLNMGSMKTGVSDMNSRVWEFWISWNECVCLEEEETNLLAVLSCGAVWEDANSSELKFSAVPFNLFCWYFWEEWEFKDKGDEDESFGARSPEEKITNLDVLTVFISWECNNINTQFPAWRVKHTSFIVK